MVFCDSDTDTPCIPKRDVMFCESRCDVCDSDWWCSEIGISDVVILLGMKTWTIEEICKNSFYQDASIHTWWFEMNVKLWPVKSKDGAMKSKGIWIWWFEIEKKPWTGWKIGVYAFKPGNIQTGCFERGMKPCTAEDRDVCYQARKQPDMMVWDRYETLNSGRSDCML